MSETLIIGAGLAGLAAAIKSAESGRHVTIVSPAVSERSQSVMAMGGTNGALNTKGQNDSPLQHYEDTLKGGCYLGSPSAIKRLTDNAPETIMWMARNGVNFTRDSNGNPDLRYFGGQKKMRTAYAGAHTGKQEVTGLASQMRKYEAAGLINEITGLRFLSLVRDESGTCAGAVFINSDTEETAVYPADTVIFASGAPNSVYGKTTGSVMNDGCASGLAMTDGIVFANMEMVQFHPTTISVRGKHMLITEAARGLGGRLYANRDGEKWYFMEEWYPERGALMPRDVVSRSIYRVCNEFGLKNQGRDEVLLDITHLSPKVIERDLDEVLDTCLVYLGLDPRRTPIPVYPGVHYFMGGMLTDEYHRTNIPHVYAAGECSCQYHGANRLGGNSTLGAVYGGLVAAEDGISAGEYENHEKQRKLCETELRHQKELLEQHRKDAASGTADSRELRKQIADVMTQSMGIYRNGSDLERGVIRLYGLLEKTGKIPASSGYYEYLTTRSSAMLALAMTKSALVRKESRGSHQRTDFPDTDDEKFKKNILAEYKDGKIDIMTGEIV
jgi:succinate dehydrogenase / fumarate reductase, flavoprotein subunit